MTGIRTVAGVATAIARARGSFPFVGMEFIVMSLNIATMDTPILAVLATRNARALVLFQRAGMAIIAPRLKHATMVISMNVVAVTRIVQSSVKARSAGMKSSALKQEFVMTGMPTRVAHVGPIALD